MMKLTVNGQEKTCPAPLDIAGLLAAEGYGDKLVAVALNSTFVPKEKRAETTLKDGDILEIVAPMQGVRYGHA